MSISDLGAQRLQAILEAQTRIASAQLDPDGVMATTASEAQGLTSSDGAAIHLLENGELVCTAASGSLRREVGRVATGEGTAASAVAEGRAIRDGDSLSAPILRDGAPWGAITVVAAEGEIDDADGAALEVITDLASTCISHAFDYVAKEKESRIDPVTGLTSGVALGDRIGSELARSRRAEEPLSLVLLEIDDLEAVVKRGPAALERAATTVADVLRAGRASDIQFRLGTGSFAVLMPETDKAGAEIASIRLAWSVATAGAGEGDLTVTVGVAQPDAEDAYSFIAAAELALQESRAALARG